TIRAHQNTVKRIAACPSSGLFASTTWDDVAVFDAATLTEVQRFKGRHKAGWINCLALSRNGSVVSGDQGGQGHVWDARSGRVTASKTATSSQVVEAKSPELGQAAIRF